jgi:hypothetical protein
VAWRLGSPRDYRKGQDTPLAVPVFLRSLEETNFSTWLRESNSVFAFYFILLFHTFGLALLVGANAIVDLRILGVAANLPLAPLKRFFSIMWVGFTLNVITGILLVIAYPTKALTNPVFYLKLTCIALAVTVMQKTYKRVFSDAGLSEELMEANGRALAKWSLVLWVAAITAGRLLAYTYSYLLYSHTPTGR